MPAHRTTLGTTRIHLALALVAALTGTVQGLAVATAVVCLTALRLWARTRLAVPAGLVGSVALGAAALPGPERRQVLDRSGDSGQRLAG